VYIIKAVSLPRRLFVLTVVPFDCNMGGPKSSWPIKSCWFVTHNCRGHSAVKGKESKILEEMCLGNVVVILSNSA
jgi:hypothetical protein